MSYPWAYIAAAALLLVIYGFRPLWQWRLRHIPGPRPTWMLGNVLKLMGNGALTYPQELQKQYGPVVKHCQPPPPLPHHTHHYPQELQKQYGPVVKMYGPIKPVVVVTSPALARDVLVHNNARTSAFVMKDTSSKASVEWDEASIITSRGQMWKHVRSAWSPMFFTGSLEGFAELMSSSAAALTQRLGSVADKGEIIDIWHWVGDMTMDVIGTAAFGVDLQRQRRDSTPDAVEASRSEQLRSDIVTFLRATSEGPSPWFLALVLFPDFGPVISWLSSRFPDSKMVPIRRAKERLIALTSDMVDQHRASLKLQEDAAGAKAPAHASTVFPHKVEGPAELPGSKAELRKGIRPGSFIDLLVRDGGKDSSKQFTHVELANQVFTMIVAGYETTGNTLAFTVWNLARCPDKAAKLCAEIDAAPGKATFESIDHLPYMDAVLRESLRLFPPLPVALRDAAEDQLIGGYKVHKGDSLWVPLWAIHRDESLWPNAEAFIPERWLDSAPEIPNQSPHAWQAFGGGPRGCPGQRFGLQEAKIALHHIFSQFAFRLGPGMEPLPLRNALTLAPRDGVQVTVHRRPQD